MQNINTFINVFIVQLNIKKTPKKQNLADSKKKLNTRNATMKKREKKLAKIGCVLN